MPFRTRDARLSREGEYRELAGDMAKARPPSGRDPRPQRARDPAGRGLGPLGAIARALETGSLATTNYRLQTVDGAVKDFEARVVPCGDDEVVAIVRDVTDLRQAIRDLKRSPAHIVAAGDAERRRVERNLHDGRSSSSSPSRFTCISSAAAWRPIPARCRCCSNRPNPELTLALEEIRELVRGLHPRLLSDRPRPRALRTRRAGAPTGRDRRAPRRAHLGDARHPAAYYIVAEALANAAKHSGASSVTVRVCHDEETVVVEVVDDGVGGADPRGSGLRGLSDRVAALGGMLARASPAGAPRSGPRSRAIGRTAPGRRAR